VKTIAKEARERKNKLLVEEAIIQINSLRTSPITADNEFARFVHHSAGILHLPHRFFPRWEGRGGKGEGRRCSYKDILLNLQDFYKVDNYLKSPKQTLKHLYKFYLL